MPDIAADNALAIEDCSNATVTMRLSGVQVVQFRAIFDAPAEVLAFGSAEVYNRAASLTCTTSSLGGCENSGHISFDVLQDGQTTARQYSSIHAFEPDELGTVVVPLTECDQ